MHSGEKWDSPIYQFSTFINASFNFNFQAHSLHQAFHRDGHQLVPRSCQCIIPSARLHLALHGCLQRAHWPDHLHNFRLQAEDLQTREEEVGSCYLIGRDHY